MKVLRKENDLKSLREAGVNGASASHRQKKNRESAKRSRTNGKDKVDSLVQGLATLQKEQEFLTKELSSLRRERAKLSLIWRDHAAKGCQYAWENIHRSTPGEAVNTFSSLRRTESRDAHTDGQTLHNDIKQKSLTNEQSPLCHQLPPHPDQVQILSLEHVEPVDSLSPDSNLPDQQSFTDQLLSPNLEGTTNSMPHGHDESDLRSSYIHSSHKFQYHSQDSHDTQFSQRYQSDNMPEPSHLSTYHVTRSPNLSVTATEPSQTPASECSQPQESLSCSTQENASQGDLAEQECNDVRIGQDSIDGNAIPSLLSLFNDISALYGANEDIYLSEIVPSPVNEQELAGTKRLETTNSIHSKNNGKEHARYHSKNSSAIFVADRLTNLKRYDSTGSLLSPTSTQGDFDYSPPVYDDEDDLFFNESTIAML